MSTKYMITADRGQIIGRRRRQEDSVDGGVVSDKCVYFVLADGMGGHEGGDKASQAAVAAFGQTLRQEGDLRKALYATNDFLSYLKSQRKLPESAGCTLIGVMIQGTTCSAISVGDSYLYRRTLNGELRLLNKLHNQGAELDAMAESGQITAKQAAESPSRNALTSAVTGAPLRMVDYIEPFEVEVGERLILLSDGYLTIGSATLEKILNHYPAEDAEAPQKIVSQVLKSVEDIGFAHQDNTSIITVQLTPVDTREKCTQFTGFENLSDERSLTPKLIAALAGLLVTCGACGYLVFSGGITAPEEEAPLGGGSGGTVGAQVTASYKLNSSRASSSSSNPNADAQSARAWQQLYGMLKQSNEERLRSVVTQDWTTLENVRGAEILNYEQLVYILEILKHYEASLSVGQQGGGEDVENGKGLQCLVFEGMMYRAAQKDGVGAEFMKHVQADLVHFFQERVDAFKKNKKGGAEKLVQFIELCVGLDGRDLIKHMPDMLLMVQAKQKQVGDDSVRQKMDVLLLHAAGYKSPADVVVAVTRARNTPSVWPDLYRILKEQALGENSKSTLFAAVGQDDVVSLTQNLAHIYACNKKPMKELLPVLQDKPIMEFILKNAYRSYISMEEADRQAFTDMLLHHMAPSEHKFSLDDLLKITGRSQRELQTVLPAIAVVADAKGVALVIPELATHLTIDKTPKKSLKHERRANDAKKAKLCAALKKALLGGKNPDDFLESCKVFSVLSMSCSDSIGENGSLSEYKIRKIMNSNLAENELKDLYNDIIAEFDAELAYLNESKKKFLPNLCDEVQREVSKRKLNIEKWWNETPPTPAPKTEPQPASATPAAPAENAKPATPAQQPSHEAAPAPGTPQSTTNDNTKVA